MKSPLNTPNKRGLPRKFFLSEWKKNCLKSIETAKPYECHQENQLTHYSSLHQHKCKDKHLHRHHRCQSKHSKRRTFLCSGVCWLFIVQSTIGLAVLFAERVAPDAMAAVYFQRNPTVLGYGALAVSRAVNLGVSIIGAAGASILSVANGGASTSVIAPTNNEPHKLEENCNRGQNGWFSDVSFPFLGHKHTSNDVFALSELAIAVNRNLNNFGGTLWQIGSSLAFNF